MEEVAAAAVLDQAARELTAAAATDAVVGGAKFVAAEAEAASRKRRARKRDRNRGPGSDRGGRDEIHLSSDASATYDSLRARPE